MFQRTEFKTCTFFRTCIFLILHIFLCVSFSSLGADMFAWFKKQKVILSSSVSGRIIDGNKPLQGIIVYRDLTYGKNYKDTAITDRNGQFTFPGKVINSSKPNNMLDNDPIQQNLYIKKQGEKLTLWGGYFFSISPENKAIRGYLSNLFCDINNAHKTYDIPIKSSTDHELSIYSLCNLQ